MRRFGRAQQCSSREACARDASAGFQLACTYVQPTLSNRVRMTPLPPSLLASRIATWRFSHAGAGGALCPHSYAALGPQTHVPAGGLKGVEGGVAEFGQCRLSPCPTRCNNGKAPLKDW